MNTQHTLSTAPAPWTIDERLAWVARFRRAIASDRDRLASLVEADTGKPAWETLTGDVMPLLAACRWHERRAPRVLRDRRVRGGAVWQTGIRQKVHRAPLGRVAIVATWNYPLLLLGVQLVQALIAGNRVVVKPSEHAPRSQRALLELATEAAMPPGLLEWTEATREAGPELIARGDFDHVIFTGSTDVGRVIAGELSESLTASTLELSGRDSAIVLDDADPVLAARSVWRAVVFNAGQTCMAPRRALVEPKAYGEFVRTIGSLASADGARRLVLRDSARGIHEIAERAVEAGGRSVTGLLEPPERNAMRPIGIADCPEHAELVEGRFFGPALAIVPAHDLDHALEIHRRCDQHLATSVYTRRTGFARDLAPHLGVTTVTINDTLLPTAHPGASIGGRGPSGWGLSQGTEGLLAMTRPVFVSITPGPLRPPIHEPNPQTASRIGAFIGRLYGAKASSTKGTPHGQPSERAS
ncbi:MAG: aldehyde dehydrogenase family protein [Planctomycetota bacterium]